MEDSPHFKDVAVINQGFEEVGTDREVGRRWLHRRCCQHQSSGIDPPSIASGLTRNSGRSPAKTCNTWRATSVAISSMESTVELAMWGARTVRSTRSEEHTSELQ